MDCLTFTLSPQKGETHHHGRVATKVTCAYLPPSCVKEEKFTLFYKPRDARVDCAVIELFGDINALPSDQKSALDDLPYYTIGCLESPPCSIWECIQGKEAGAIGVMNAICTSYQGDIRAKAITRLNRLESVCAALGLSDLHGENVIIRLCANGAIESVPIDLESFQQGATGLFGDFPHHILELSQKEKELVDECQKKIATYQRRHVLIPTTVFGDTPITGCQQLADLMYKELEREYRVVIERNELAILILDDFLEGDLPYLTIKDTLVYYENTLIAKKEGIYDDAT